MQLVQLPAQHHTHVCLSCMRMGALQSQQQQHTAAGASRTHRAHLAAATHSRFCQRASATAMAQMLAARQVHKVQGLAELH